MDKSLILNEIKKNYGFVKDIDFAEFLGINQSTLSNWHKRGTIDYEKIISKCELLDANWLFSGEGKMFRNVENISMVSETQEVYAKEEKIIDSLKNEISYKNEIIAGLKRENKLLWKLVDGDDDSNGKKKIG